MSYRPLKSPVGVVCVLTDRPAAAQWETVSAINAYFVRDTDIGHFYAIRQSRQTEDDHACATASNEVPPPPSSIRSIAEVCLASSFVYDLTCKGNGNKVNIEGVSRARFMSDVIVR